MEKDQLRQSPIFTSVEQKSLNRLRMERNSHQQCLKNYSVLYTLLIGMTLYFLTEKASVESFADYRGL